MSISSLAAVSALLPLPRSKVTSLGASPAAYIGAAFVKQQSDLILARTSTATKAKTYQGTLSRVVDFERSARDMLSLDGLNSPFAKREVSTGDSSVATASAVDLAQTRNFGVTVTNLATTHTARSDNRNTADAHGLGSGLEDFRVNSRGTNFDLSVRKEDYSTNLELMEAVATEINDNENIGIFAEVITSDSTGKSYLSVAATTTGTDATFTITDLGDTLMADLGLETTQQADPSAGTGGILVTAEDAQYAIDSGSTQTSQSNTIKLYDDQVTLTLAGTSSTPVTMAVQPGASDISTAIQGFLTARDNLLDYLNDNEGPGTTPLAYKLMQTAQRNSLDLAEMGITIDSDGTFSVDSTKLEAAITDDYGQVFSAIAGAHGLAIEGQRVARTFLDASSSAITEPENSVAAAALLSHQDSYNLGMLVNLVG